MSGRRGSTAGFLPRLLLLLGLLLGVASMHTFGHLVHEGSTNGDSYSSALSAASSHSVASHIDPGHPRAVQEHGDLVGTMASGPRDHATARHSGGTGRFDPFAVCVAVLIAAAAIGCVLLSRHVPTGLRQRATRRGSAAATSRGPPRPLFTRVVVLRI